MNILVFGSLNQDIVYDIDHFGQPGETTKAHQVSQYPGGKGLNQAIAASQAGSPVSMAGCIGLDGTWLTALLEEKGVQTGHVHTLEAARTGTAIIERDPAGHNRILLDPGANSLCTLQQIQDTLTAYQPGDLLICQNETSLTRQLVQEAGSRQLQILFNPAPMTADIRDMDLSCVTWLAVNETECAQLLDTGSRDPLTLCRLFRRRYPETSLLLTLGSQGAICLQNEQLWFMPAFQVKAVDTTGAGDTWLGYFADGLRRGLPVGQIMKRASAAAALAVTREGAASSIPEDSQVEDFLQAQTEEPEKTVLSPLSA
ncbi:ribokinase [uncultured Faecalibaculum sp.]|uniref:ribokinase n=1 Tax=uncultured Faecalibaculum sp. TaxID=1729681 RepID=UPI00260906FB|nr:ribokinase [uncultured Faecalibaculum sp.]